MVILGIPKNIEEYIMLDEYTGFQLHQKGITPAYRDEDCLYFKKNNKLYKALDKLGLNIEDE